MRKIINGNYKFKKIYFNSFSSLAQGSQLVAHRPNALGIGAASF